ncbi:MAG: ABC transporter ATP-binding protein [Eubacterium sp.]|nr:ABC transporter ATP-binding protein [Eubacterium sp.]
MNEIVRLEHVKKYYGTQENMVRALDGVSLTVEKGTFVGITGTSGSGKSTLLHIMGGLDQPTSGDVVIGGKNISRMNNEELTIFRRRHIGFVFQSYNLIPVLNVLENITFPLKIERKKPDERFVNAVLKFLGIHEKIYALPSQLSGGQQQRVAIARALITKPAIILADEPTGNLDSANSAEVVRLLCEGCKKLGQTVVMITHDEKIAAQADVTVNIQDGRIN